MNIFGALFLTLISSACLAQKNLSLQEAVEIALKQNPSHQEIAERINQSAAETEFVRSTLYPNLTAVAGRYQVKDATNASPKFNGNPYEQYSTSLKLNQTIFKIGSLKAIDAAEKDIQVSRIDTEIDKRDLIAAVIQSYYQVIFSRKNLDTLTAQEKIAKEAVDVTQKRERTGRSQNLDLLQAQTQLELLHGQLSGAQNSLQISMATLLRLLGEKSNEMRFQISGEIATPAREQFEKIMPARFEEIPEIKRSVISLAKTQDLRDVLWGQNLPSFELIGNYNFGSSYASELIRNDANSWSIGLQLTIPLFSGFSYQQQKKALLSQELQLQYNQKSVENQISYQQVTNRNNLDSAHSSIRTGIESLRLAEASSKEARRNYKLNTIDFLQYLSAQQAQSQAELSLNSYKYSYLVALTNYFSATGQNLDRLVDLLH